MFEMVYGISFGLSLLMVVLLTPLVILLCRRFSLYDTPNPRKLHNRRVPTLGGLALFVGFFATTFAVSFLLRWPGLTNQTVKIFLGSIPLVAVSLYDDLKGASVWIRFLFQSLGGLIFVFLAHPLESIAVPWLGSISLGIFSYPAMILWLLLMANAINFIDGLDGLAAGICAISAATLFASALMGKNTGPAVLALAVMGTSIGFLPYNFYPAKIFMGDTGATLLGFILGAIALLGAGKSVAFVSLLLPMIAFGIPIVDTLTAVVRRSVKRKNIFAADQEHIHHKILTLGITHRRAVIYLYIISGLLGAIGLSLFYQNRFISLALFVIGLIVTLILFRR